MKRLHYWIGVLGIVIVLAGCASGVETLDRDALLADAVATVEARQADQIAASAAQAAREAVAAEAETVPIATNNGLEMSLGLETTLVDLYESLNPSVVYIGIIREGFGVVGNGSGFVYDDVGNIVTNNHVVADADALEVVFSDGTRVDAEIVGTDVDSDLAVIKVPFLPENVAPLPLGDLSNIQVGQFVIAIGSPFQQENSMSLGIISALGRSLDSQRLSEAGGGFARYELPQVIQTDAPINPGNSGGPLLNLQGEVVGVNSAIRSATGVNSGVGFAIPVNAVKRIAPSLIADGAHQYPYMGIGVAQPELLAENFASLGLESPFGALVTYTTDNSPASRAGLQPNDVIVQLDNRPIQDFSDLNSYLVFETNVGQTIDVVVIRDGEQVTLPLELGARP